MIIDLQKFLAEERPYWQRLESILQRMAKDAAFKFSLEEAQTFHYLYQRASSDLAKIRTFSAEREVRSYLELLVSRAYAEIHGEREKGKKIRPLKWFFQDFPNTFRRHIRALGLAVLVTIVGGVFGGLALNFDEEAKAVIMPFSHLHGDPSDRVHKEESVTEDRMDGVKVAFAGQLMTHNTRVSILTMVLGITWGIGTLILLFYNGVILGSVCIDYVMAGETEFLIAWLLPHGSIEIPAILIAGQAGFVLAKSLIGWGTRDTLSQRMRKIGPDVATLMGGVALMLVWAGVIESFLSQYHEPRIPYQVKILFGMVELILLLVFLLRSGRTPIKRENPLRVTAEV